MDKSAAEAFVYAKASGILGKSFTGEKATLIFNSKSLGELWTLIFGTQPPAIPEKLLAQEIEKEAFKRFINQYEDFIKLYDSVENDTEILTKQLYIYEAENLKEVQDALSSGEQKCPELINLGKFSRIDYSAWPNLALMTKNSPFSWCNEVPDIHEKQAEEFKIDIQVVQELWNAMKKISGEESQALENLYLNEYVIKNIVWALRLKIFYKMPNEKILENLIYVTEKPSLKDPVAAPAIKILEKEIDNYSHWADWKYSELVNPHVNGEVWAIEPNWIEKSNRVRINKLAKLVFHQYPMTTASLIAWFKIKNFELSCIRTAVESLRMGINSKDAMNTIGILSE